MSCGASETALLACDELDEDDVDEESCVGKLFPLVRNKGNSSGGMASELKTFASMLDLVACSRWVTCKEYNRLQHSAPSRFRAALAVRIHEYFSFH